MKLENSVKELGEASREAFLKSSSTRKILLPSIFRAMIWGSLFDKPWDAL
jgi:hypothetical protein